MAARRPSALAPPAPVYNYAQPIAVSAPIAVPEPGTTTNVYAPPPVDTSDRNAAAAARLLDDARQAFLVNDYNGALQFTERAIAASPKDTIAHEFRALVLFAQGRYQEAAATIYAVLAVAPGWNWDTLGSFYRDVQTYTAQLRALEAYTAANPKDAAAQFLLAYHYLVTDHRDAAARVLRTVVALQPNDHLAAYILQMLETPQ